MQASAKLKRKLFLHLPPSTARFVFSSFFIPPLMYINIWECVWVGAKDKDTFTTASTTTTTSTMKRKSRTWQSCWHTSGLKIARQNVCPVSYPRTPSPSLLWHWLAPVSGPLSCLPWLADSLPVSTNRHFYYKTLSLPNTKTTTTMTTTTRRKIRKDQRQLGSCVRWMKRGCGWEVGECVFCV